MPPLATGTRTHTDAGKIEKVRALLQKALEDNARLTAALVSLKSGHATYSTVLKSGHATALAKANSEKAAAEAKAAVAEAKAAEATLDFVKLQATAELEKKLAVAETKIKAGGLVISHVTGQMAATAPADGTPGPSAPPPATPQALSFSAFFQ